MTSTLHGGPKTETGKARASTNSCRHGLRSRGVLLRHESEDAYLEHVEAVVASLAPHGAVETQIAAEYADLMWVRRRWMGAVMDQIVEQADMAASKSDARMNADACKDALAGLDALIVNVEGALQARITSGLSPLTDGAKAVFGLIKDADAVAGDELERLHAAIKSVGASRRKEDRLRTLAALHEVSKALRPTVEEKRQVAEENLARLRALLAEVATPTPAGSRRRERYRRLLDHPGGSLMATLEQMKRFRTAQPAAESSLEPALQGQSAELRLRIVR